MTEAKQRKLKGYHVVFLIQNSMIGYSLLLLPNILSPAGRNQWWIVLILGSVAQVTLYPMIRLASHYPGLNLFNINEQLLGKWIGKTVTFVFIFYGLLQLSLVVSGYLQLITTVSLPGIKWFGPLTYLFVVTIYILSGGIKLIARMCILTFFLTGWMLYFLSWSFAKGDVLNLLPMFSNVSVNSTLQSFHAGFELMLGYEIILVYFPYIIDQKKAFKHASIGIWITTLIYLVVCITSIIYFSEWELNHVRFPVLNIIKSVELTFMERIENFGLTLWVFLTITTISLYLWMSKKAMDCLTGKNRTKHVYVCTTVAFLIIGNPFSLDIIEYMNAIHLSAYMGYSVILWSYFLLMIHYIKRHRRHSET